MRVPNPREHCSVCRERFANKDGLCSTCYRERKKRRERKFSRR